MALIRTFKCKSRDRYSIHDEIEATYVPFERDGRIILQIDTYGRKTRQVPEKQSQTIQLDEIGAQSLYTIIKDTFHFN